MFGFQIKFKHFLILANLNDAFLNFVSKEAHLSKLEIDKIQGKYLQNIIREFHENSQPNKNEDATDQVCSSLCEF